MTRSRVRNVTLALVALLGGAAFATSIGSTGAAWEDRGGSSMTVTAIDQRPPNVTGPVTPDTGSTFVGPPLWSGHNGSPTPTPRYMCFTVEIRTTSTTPVAWRVILETDRPPFNNVAPFDGFDFQLFGDGASYGFAPAADYAITGRYVMTPTQSSQWASVTQSYTAKACASTPEPAWQPPGPTTYTQRPTLELVRNGSQPCVAATVDGHQPYFVGFSVSFDWKAFLDGQLAASAITPAEYDQWLTFTHWAGGPPGYLAAQGATGTDYLVTLQGYEEASRNVYAPTPVTIASCSY
ncbi:hypothetical protein [Agromyces sp. Marseille-Q5079]|uniref:hypothetical protein n=1 Tax=Agromyces sp. Marseille-Q5079 TaxID=3439059 RepID=UPI003D9CBC95